MGQHCDATQLLLQFEGRREMGEEQSAGRGQPTSPGSGQSDSEHQPCRRDRHLVRVSVIRGNEC